MTLKKLSRLALATAALMGAGIGSAQAVPLLQLYIEGATYNVSTETWELARPIDEPPRLTRPPAATAPPAPTVSTAPTIPPASTAPTSSTETR